MVFNPILIDLKWTSKLGWRCFEANKIDKNELQIRKNSQKGTETKMAEKINNSENFDRKKNQITALFSTQWPPNESPDALDHWKFVT